MTGQRTPAIDLETLGGLLAFVNNKATIAKFLDNAREIVKKNEAILATIGKAKEIDRLHAAAEDLKASVLSEIEKREAALEETREKAMAEIAAGRAAVVKEQRDAGAKATAMRSEAQDRLNAAKAAETAANENAAEANKARQQAENAREQAMTLKASYESKMKRIEAMTAEVA